MEFYSKHKLDKMFVLRSLVSRFELRINTFVTNAITAYCTILIRFIEQKSIIPFRHLSRATMILPSLGLMQKQQIASSRSYNVLILLFSFNFISGGSSFETQSLSSSFKTIAMTLAQHQWRRRRISANRFLLIATLLVLLGISGKSD
jgi:hypothetical protein